jgi:hypothetical protein
MKDGNVEENGREWKRWKKEYKKREWKRMEERI